MSIWFGLIGRVFSGGTADEAVATASHFPVSAEAVWRCMLLYEDVPARPSLLLRTLLPYPVRTEGDKTRVGARIQCTYHGGDLVKCISRVEAPHLLEFEVLEQRLGIEGCVRTVGGSYEIRSEDDGAEVVLTTNYLGHLRPRSMWRPVEQFLARQLHRHILNGMRASLPGSGQRARTTAV